MTMQYGTGYHPMVNPPMSFLDRLRNFDITKTRMYEMATGNPPQPVLSPTPAVTQQNIQPQNAPALTMPSVVTQANAATPALALPANNAVSPVDQMIAAGQSQQGGTADQYANSPYANTGIVVKPTEPAPAPPSPVLTNPNTPASAGALSPNQGQGRRSNTQLAVQRPDLGIGTNEMLMRVGGAGLEGAQRGGLQAYSNMLGTYGNIQDQRRANAMTGYNADYQAQQDEQARLDALETARLEAASKSGPDADTQQQIGQMDQTLFDMDRALANLEGGMELTGWFDATVGAAIDNFKGNPEAAGRLLLQKLKVDDTLLRVAQTKGAISNKEMDLFMSPAPSNFSDEKVWIDWIKERKQAIQQVRARLAGGQTVNQDQQATSAQVDQFSTGVPAVGQSTSVGGVTVKRIS